MCRSSSLPHFQQRINRTHILSCQPPPAGHTVLYRLNTALTLYTTASQHLHWRHSTHFRLPVLASMDFGGNWPLARRESTKVRSLHSYGLVLSRPSSLLHPQQTNNARTEILQHNGRKPPKQLALLSLSTSPLRRSLHKRACSETTSLSVA